MLDPSLADALGPLGTDELIGAISWLLVRAKMSLETDLFGAKTLIDQASALIGLRADMTDDLPSIEAHAQALAPWQVKRLTSFVSINMASVIRNADMAAAVGLSQSHFLKAFKQSLGITPQAYVAQRRVQHAKHLMLSTDEPLAQIALACGLADQAHFSTYFRRVTGATPAQWRRTYRECSEGLRHGRAAPMGLCQGRRGNEPQFGAWEAM
jgi:transcriptional regulator GlxA family with amidase domain